MKNSTKKKRFLPGLYVDAKQLELALTSPDVGLDAKRQLTLATLEAAINKGVTVASPELARIAYLTIISRQTRKIETFHHFEMPEMRLMHLINLVSRGETLTGLTAEMASCPDCRKSFDEFVLRSQTFPFYLIEGGLEK